MDAAELEVVTLAPDLPARTTLILLHGLGADGHDLMPLVPLLGFEPDDALRIVLPQAPVRPVTINGGLAMRAWYDMQAIAPLRRVNAADVAASVAAIQALLHREERGGVPSTGIFLAGFSQGGAIALLAGLGHDRPLAGVVALSCYRPELGTSPVRDPANAATPVWHAHGSRDEVVPPALGRAAYEEVVAGGNPASWREYPIGHEVSAPELAELGAWMRVQITSAREHVNGR